MGGRRAANLGEILGGGPEPQKEFRRAVGTKDPETIAIKSAELVAESEKISDVLYYVSKLADFVQREATSEQELNYQEREHRARQEWARVKKREGVKDDPIVTKAVVSAVVKAIGKRKK
jgi:hypothetical protein